MPRDSSGRPDGSLYRQDFDAPDVGWCCLYHHRLPVARFLILKWNVPFYFGGTSLLIIVVVTMDFHDPSSSLRDVASVRGLLKKANFKGSGYTAK